MIYIAIAISMTYKQTRFHLKQLTAVKDSLRKNKTSQLTSGGYGKAKQTPGKG